MIEKFLLVWAFILIGVLSYNAFHSHNQAFDYRRAYESARNELESLQRTAGKVNPAYECKKRIVK